MGYVESANKFDKEKYLNIESSISLNTNDDVVAVRSFDGTQLEEGFTLSCWIYIDPNAVNTFMKHFVLTDGTVEVFSLEMGNPSIESLRFVAGANVFETSISLGTLKGKWLNHTVTYNSTTLEVRQYLNGLLNVVNILPSALVFTDDDFLRFGNGITDPTIKRFYGEICEYSLFTRDLAPYEIKFYHDHITSFLEVSAKNIIGYWSMQNDIYKADIAFSDKHDGVNLNELVVFDDANKFNVLKESWFEWDIDDAEDPDSFGVLNALNWIISTNGLGRITIDQQGDNVMPFAYYEISASTSNDIEVEVTLESSNVAGDALWVFVAERVGSTIYSESIAASGTYTFRFVLDAISSGNPIRLGVGTDLTGGDVGDYIEFKSIRTYVPKQKPIYKPLHGVLEGKSDNDVGVIRRSAATDLPNFYSKSIIKDSAFKLSGTKGTILSTMIGIGVGDFSMAFHFENIDQSIAVRSLWGNTPNSTAYESIEVTNTGFSLIRSALPSLQVTAVDLGLITIPERTKCIVLVTWESGNQISMTVKVIGKSSAFTRTITESYSFLGVAANKNLCQLGLSDVISHLSEHHRVITFKEVEELSFNIAPELNLDFSDIAGNEVRDKVTGLPYALTGFTADEELTGGGIRLESKTLLPHVTEYLYMDGTKYFSTKTPFNPSGDVFTIFFQATVLDSSPGGTWNQKTVFTANQQSVRNPSISVVFRDTAQVSFFVFDSSGAGQRVYQFVGESKLYDGLYSTIVKYDSTSTPNGTDIINDFLRKNTPVVASPVVALNFNDINEKVHIGFPTAATGITQMNISQLIVWDRELTEAEIRSLSNYNTPDLRLNLTGDKFQENMLLNFQFQKGAAQAGVAAVEIKNQAPASSFPSGGATQPSDWDIEGFGFAGATPSDQLLDLRSTIFEINTLR